MFNEAEQLSYILEHKTQLLKKHAIEYIIDSLVF